MNEMAQETTQTLTVAVADADVDREAVGRKAASLTKHQGISSAQLTSTGSRSTLVLEYQTLVLSEKSVLDLVKESGINLRIEPARKRGVIGRFIDRLAESNQRTFGSNRLDCCDINRNDRPETR